ncbi:40S ribosomal protein S3-1, partial [Cucurbita argyrosperma subsp. sororia]
MATQMSKKRKFVADGVFFAELNEVLTRELAEDGYSGVEVRVTPMRTEIIIRATRTQNVLGEKGRRIRELTSVVQKRFKFPENSVELYAEKVNNRGLCAIAQAESLRYKLLGGLAVRRACYGVLRFVMESGAKGCEVIVSGKLRAQRAKSMKFKDGYMISSGQPVRDYIDSAVRHVLLRQGVLGIKVKIMLDWDPKGKQGPTTPLPDVVVIHSPKEEEEIVHRPAAAAAPPVLSADIELSCCRVFTAPNAIPAIVAGDVNSKLLVQILDVKMIGNAQERYSLLISDAVSADGWLFSPFVLLKSAYMITSRGKWFYCRFTFLFEMLGQQFSFRLISGIESAETNSILDVISIVTSTNPSIPVLSKNGMETQRRVHNLKDASGKRCRGVVITDILFMPKSKTILV